MASPGRGSSFDKLRMSGGKAAYIVATLAVLAGAALFGRGGTAAVPAALIPPFGSWVYLSDLLWERTSTEWFMLANEGLPSVDSAFFTGGPLLIGEESFVKGLGTHAPSEIVYQLDKAFARLDTLVGVESDALPGRPGAQFLVFLDGVKAYESPVLTSSDRPLRLELALHGVEELRLVAVRAEDAKRGPRVAWADARLLKATGDLDEIATEFVRWVQESGAVRAAQRTAHEAALEIEARAEIARLRQDLGGAFPGPDQLPVAVPGRSSVSLVNNRLAVSYGLGGEGHGLLSVLDLSTQRFVAKDLASSVKWAGGELDLARDTRSTRSTRVEEVEHPVLGPGTKLSIGLAGRDAGASVELTVFRDGAVLLSRISLEGLPEDEQLEVRHVESGPGAGLQVGERTHYLAELTRLRHVIAGDDGIRRQDQIAWGKPVYLWDEKGGRALILALLDETSQPPLLTFQHQPGEALGKVSLRATRPATMYFEIPAGSSPQEHFSRYRQLSAHLYPPAPLPDWFKYQWLSWYVYYMDINEDLLVRQIDAIAENFGDLGPWHIIIDAGWYVAEGRVGSEWRNVDREKFPNGLRWLVDYAHSKDVRVVLYFTAPYLNSREASWDWLGLRALVERHPEWLIPLDEEEPFDDYAYDFQNPELRDYMKLVMRDFFLRYGVDGIKLDGLGSAGDAVLYSAEGGAFSLSDRALGQTMEVYRFVYAEAKRYRPDAYIESGWIVPAMANPYAHTFRYGDEEPLFTRPYPLPGLIEHIDYTAYQQAMLGQRSNMGAVYGEPNESSINAWWLGAGLAMGAQTSLSFNFETLTPASISLYRSLLTPYRPFEGTTIIDRRLEQQVFSTRVDGTWHVGVLNRAPTTRRITLEPSALGLPRGASFHLYDVEEGRARHASGGFSLTVQPESFRLLVVRTDPGVMWTNSVVEPVPRDDGRLSYRIQGPPTVDGVLHLYVFETPTVYFGGTRMEPSMDPFAGQEGYSYDGDAGLLTFWYPAGASGVLTIEHP